MMAAPATGGKVSFLQKKELGLPIWAWALIVAGGAGAFILYTRMKSSSSSSTGAATSPTTTTTGSTGPGGFGVGGYGGSGGGGTGPGSTMPTSPPAQGVPPEPGGTSGPIPVGPPPNGQPIYGGAPAPSSPGNPSLPFQVQSGSGWWAGGANWATDNAQQQAQATAAAQAAGPITDASGNEYEWLDSAEYNSIANTGTPVYYEVLPGVFVPVPAGLAGLAPGTPLYMQVPSGTAQNPSQTPTVTPPIGPVTSPAPVAAGG